MAFQAILPKIFVAFEDDERLRRIATPLAKRGSWAAGFLLAELDRSVPCASRDLPEDAVAMGRRVTYTVDDSGAPESGTLSYPDECRPFSGRISVLSPLGAALFGLRAGSSMRYAAPAGRDRAVTVVRVDAPRTSNVLAFSPRKSRAAARRVDPEPDGAA